MTFFGKSVQALPMEELDWRPNKESNPARWVVGHLWFEEYFANTLGERKGLRHYLPSVTEALAYTTRKVMRGDLRRTRSALLFHLDIQIAAAQAWANRAATCAKPIAAMQTWWTRPVGMCTAMPGGPI